MLIVMFVFSFGLANFQSTISLYVDHKYGYTPSQIAVLITVGGFVGVIVQTFVINPLFKQYGEMRVILFNFVVAAVSMLAILFVDMFWTILFVATIFFTATALLRPAVNTLVSKLAGEEQGYAAGMMNAYMSLGNMIGPAIAGLLFRHKYYLSLYIGHCHPPDLFRDRSHWARETRIYLPDDEKIIEKNPYLPKLGDKGFFISSSHITVCSIILLSIVHL